MLLKVENLTISFTNSAGSFRAVDDISFEIAEGETLGLVGESGCGKTVTALSLLRLIPEPPGKMEAGQILFNGKSLTGLSASELRKVRGREISMIFQEPMTSLNPVFTIGDQIIEAIRLHQPLSKTSARDLCLEMMNLVGIPDVKERIDYYPHQMSGGLRQRVMIAMALSCQPKLLIADEPTTALDVTIQAQILELIKSLQKKMGMSVLLITHDFGVIAEMADRVHVMYAGKIIEKAKATEIFDSPTHPYTRGLQRSIPSFVRPSETLYSIPGMVPDLRNLKPGCRFSERCEFKQSDCEQKEPVLEAAHLSSTHDAACFHPQKGSAQG